jgi:alanyl-tRNA synthetase
VRATGDIGAFAITEEGGVAAGVRRIEAVTGLGAIAWMQQQRAALGAVLGALNTTAAARRLRAAAARRRATRTFRRLPASS